MQHAFKGLLKTVTLLRADPVDSAESALCSKMLELFVRVILKQNALSAFYSCPRFEGLRHKVSADVSKTHHRAYRLRFHFRKI